MMAKIITKLVCILNIAACVASRAMCPSNCTCDMNTVAASLSVDCVERTGDDAQSVNEELDSFLADRIDDKLLHISITNTFLTSFPSSICQMTTLTTIYVSHNRLARLPDNCFINMKSLEVLDASLNQISELQDGLFDGLQTLRELRLDDNKIESIGLHLFSNASDLTGMRYIGLHHNLLKSLEPWPIIRGLAASKDAPVVVVLCHNQIATGTNLLNWTYHCGKRPFAEIDLDNNNISHVTDIIYGFGLDDIQLFCVLNFLTADNGVTYWNTKITFYNNPLVCDCVDFNLYRYEATSRLSNIYRDKYCALPMQLYNWEILRVPLDRFVCTLTDKCPDGCQCEYRPSDASLTVNCTNLTSLPRELPQLPKSYVRYRLNFRNGNLSQGLQYRDYFAKTREIDLTGMSIRSIDKDAWAALALIPKVVLRGNLLGSLPRSVMNTNISSNLFVLAGNPWNCSRENDWMTGWLKSIKNKLSENSGVQCSTPSALHGKNMLLLIDSDYDLPEPPTNQRPIIIVLSTTSGCLLLVAALFIAVYRLRLMLFRRWKLHPFDRDDCEGEDMDFDVFLCCSSSENEPHGLNILSHLEADGYRVCYHLRDFVGGAQIQENIATAVQRSKRTVCLLTTSFIDSVFCMHEFDVAFHHNITAKSRRLIVLTAMDIPNIIRNSNNNNNNSSVGDHDISPRLALLCQYLRQYTYIDYSRDDWLNRLRYALPVTGMNSGDVNNGDGINDDNAVLITA